jgi:protein-disulfide isomerase
VLQQLAPKYISTGKAKFVYHDYPAIGQESVWAAEAALCAGDQNKFWAYGINLFDHQGGENSGVFSISNLKQFAAQLGLNTSTFNSCIDSGKYAAEVQQELNAGIQRGVSGTPTFIINGQIYPGVMTADQMSTLIDRAAQ